MRFEGHEGRGRDDEGFGGKFQFEVPGGRTGDVLKTIYEYRSQGRAKAGTQTQKSSAYRC